MLLAEPPPASNVDRSSSGGGRFFGMDDGIPRFPLRLPPLRDSVPSLPMNNDRTLDPINNTWRDDSWSHSRDASESGRQLPRG